MDPRQSFSLFSAAPIACRFPGGFGKNIETAMGTHLTNHPKRHWKTEGKAFVSMVSWDGLTMI